MTKLFRPIFAFIIGSLLIQSCGNNIKVDPYTIGPRHIGLLSDSTQVKDLEVIFKNDSVAQNESELGTIRIVNSINVYTKSGDHLLTLSPRKIQDSTSTISTVKIEDGLYKTAEGISINSTYGELSKTYKISKIDNLIKTVVVSVDEIDASFTIDKEELPANMRFDMSLNIDPIQIPDEAKIKYFMLHW